MPLIQSVASGNEDALQTLYDKHAPDLLRYISNRLGDTRLAEEVLQDVMLAAWQGAGRFRGECRVRTWLLTIARLCAINAYHRQVLPASREAPFGDESPVWMDAPGRYHDLHTALKALSPAQVETLELIFYHGLSLEETARVLQIPLGTVKSRLNRARARLRELMNDEM